MNRLFSLHSGAEFQRVWDERRAWSHPLVILRARANGLKTCRLGFVAGKSVGKATARNRAKRLLREVMRQRLPRLAPGWDIVLIARGNAAQAQLGEIAAAVEILLRRAGLLRAD